MSLRALPLRLKLVIALVLPMLLVTVLIGDRVSDSVDRRRIASSQQDEAARLEAVAGYSNAVGTESIVTNDPTATSTQLAAARAASDSAFARVQDPSLGLAEDLLGRADTRHTGLVRIREFLGDRPSDIALRFQAEAFIDGGSVVTADGMSDTAPRALSRLKALPTQIVEDFDFDENAVVDVETTRLLTDFDLVQRLRSDYAEEVSALLQLATTPATLITDGVIADFREQLTRTDVSRNLIYDYGAPDLVSDISAGRRSVAGAEYEEIRLAAQNATPGVSPVGDIAGVNRSSGVVTAQYAELSDGVVASIRAQAESTASAATTSLVLVLLAGAWMLIIAGIVLRLLYRSIRSPLQRLTEQSQHIARVELPYVVSAMREGDLDEAPVTTDLVADANDEIGDLVHAFNDMHRTAVQLAAEQAGSRRVVADMFVNLGRRNQRLVNRLLKRLTNLERNENDPDKLAGLYEIDHVVTRMRRNAESLLVLAGASQSRKWDRPVDVYDVAQAALSEVEGYERVEILAADDFQIHGDVVADLTHLLAEVVENALTFSPPSSIVDVALRRIGDDHLVSVSDSGIGMNEAQLVDANDRIWRAGAEDETPSEFLGHYVIGRLAARHGIDVRLSSGLGGQGVVADVLIPLGAVVPAADELVDRLAPAALAASDVATSPGAADPLVSVGQVPTHDGDSTAAAFGRSASPQTSSRRVGGDLDRTAPDNDSTVESTRPSWTSVVHEVRRPESVPASEPFAPRPVHAQAPVAAPSVAVAASAMTSATTPAEVPPPTPAVVSPPVAATPPTAAPPTAAPVVATTPPLRIDAVVSPVASSPGVSSPVVPAPAAPLPSVPVDRAESLARLAVPPSTSSFDYPPIEQIDPRQRELAPRPTLSAGSASAHAAASADLDAARSSAADAVEGALSAFGSARRTPGVSLPDTSLASLFSGQMTLEIPRPASEPLTAAPNIPLTAPSADPDEIRFHLSGFQSGTRRADEEN
ncbi:MAG: ATP-binding protein [Ilumatobacter sp.]|uniref:ATP-binding protein n=1 Tax=Ilumatobacter sp. TaxID=1967498 RepID=UPI00329A314E